MLSARSIRAKNQQYYRKITAASRASSRIHYSLDQDNKKAESRTRSKAQYSKDPTSKKAASRANSKAQYSIDPAGKKAASKARYACCGSCSSFRERENGHKQ